MQAGGFEPRSAFGRGLDAAARLFALLGGAVFTALTLLSLYSIVMRNLVGSPIMGDWELVQMGCAVAIAACFPMCQMRGAPHHRGLLHPARQPRRPASGSTASARWCWRR